MPRPTQITINLSALSQNAALTRTLAAGRKVMATVKADAYGHGARQVCDVLTPWVDAFAVAITEEAVALRDAGVSKPILVLEGPFDREDVEQITRYNLWSVIHSLHQVSLLNGSRQANSLTLWLKVDTGMHRLGIAPDRLPELVATLANEGHHPVTLMSHLAFAEQPESSVNQQQNTCWNDLLAGLGPYLASSLMNSAAITQQLALANDWLRPGYMLYGGQPSVHSRTLPLQPVMRLTSQVMALRRIPRGDSVGYGGRWVAQRDSQIATIAVGYADGYPRNLGNGTPVWIADRECPLVGRVSMDMITVDVTDHPHVHIGSEAELWGEHVAIDRLAELADTIGYELMARLPQRVIRRWHYTTENT